MFKFFLFRKKAIKKEITPLVISKLDRIIELLEKQQNTSEKNIHIDHVRIDYLENITFKLDHIDIDELSGKLVIGNNINTTEEIAEALIQKIDKEGAKKEAMADTVPIEQTEKGFRFRNPP